MSAAALSGEQLIRWLDELLRDAAASGRPSMWERSFLSDIARSRRKWGERLQPSGEQMKVLRQIEAKIYAAG